MSDSNATDPKKQYSIVRYSRIGDMTTLRHVSNHNTRAVVSENVQRDGPAPVELLDDGDADITVAARRRAKELGLDLSAALRDGKVIAVEAFMGASPKFFERATPDEVEDWYRASTAFMQRRFGRALISVMKHEDEKTPHLQAVALAAVEKKVGVKGRPPKDPERRRLHDEKVAAMPVRWTFSYNDLLGGAAARLSHEQDDYNACVRHLGLARGERQKEVGDLVLDNGVVVAAARISRGKRKDGTDRPARHFTTQEYQAETRRAWARSEQHERDAAEAAARAEAKERTAEADRVAAATDRTLAAAARARGEASEAVAVATAADLARRAAGMADAEADLSRRIGDADRRDVTLATREREMEEARRKAKEDEAAAVAARADAERLADERRRAEQTARIARDVAIRDAAAAKEERASIAETTQLANADRRAATAERADAARLRDEQEAAIDRQRREVADLKAAASAERDAAERWRVATEAAHAATIDARDRAASDVAATTRKREEAEATADRMHREADAAVAAASAERAAIAATRTRIEEERRHDEALLALLVRAADDSAGLNLRLSGDTFGIGPHGLTDEERTIKKKGWSKPLIAMARSLATALDRVRAFAKRLDQRERAVEARATAIAEREARLARIHAVREAQLVEDRATHDTSMMDHQRAVVDLNQRSQDVEKLSAVNAARETRLEQDRAAHDARVAAHQRAIADLDRRRAAVDADERRVADAATAAEAQRKAAVAAQARADATLHDHLRWIAVTETLAKEPRWVEVGPGGTLVLDRRAAAVDPALATAFASTPPTWVVSLSMQRLDLADALERTADREQRTTYAAERLEAMIAQAAPVLTPVQQEVAKQAEKTIRRYRPPPGSIQW